jgi:hypothetical protein
VDERPAGRSARSLNEYLRVSEENDYLNRTKTHPESYSVENFHEKLHGFGTLSVVHKINTREAKEEKKSVKKQVKKKKQCLKRLNAK